MGSVTPPFAETPSAPEPSSVGGVCSAEGGDRESAKLYRVIERLISRLPFEHRPYPPERVHSPIRRFRFGSFIICIWVLISPTFSFVEAQDDGSSLDELRQEYYAKRQEVIEPLNEAYLAALDRLQKRLTEEGDVNGALRVLEWKTKVVARFSAAKPGMEPAAVVAEAAEATAGKMAPQEEPGAASDESDSGKTEFNPVGTVWTWSAPGVHFVFENGGIGLGKYPQLETVDANFRWERKGPRKFMVTRPENPDFQVLFEVLADGDTAVYSSLGGSIFKRMVSRIPATE